MVRAGNARVVSRTPVPVRKLNPDGTPHVPAEYTGKMFDSSDPNGTRLGMLSTSVASDDPCVECGCSTAFMSGKYPNRVAVDDGGGVDFRIKWMCAECTI